MQRRMPSFAELMSLVRSYRLLSSFDRAVLEEYIRRGCWFPEELVRIERELGAAPVGAGGEKEQSRETGSST
jgi:hypothetical protein